MAAAGSMPSESRRRACCFGPASAAMLLTHNGSRWKLWSEREGSVQLSHNDASESYTAACWGGAQSSEHADGLFALGCASGRVQVWNPRSAEQVGPTAGAFHEVGRGADCAIAALALPNTHRGSVFAACTAFPDILEIGVLDGGIRTSFKADKVGVAKLAIGGPGAEWLLSAGAGSTLKLWSVAHIGSESQSVPQRLTSPVNPATCVDVGNNAGSLLALCCDGAPQIDIYVVPVQGATGRSAGRPGAQKEASLVLSGHEQVWSAQFVRNTPDTLQGAASKSASVVVVGFGPSAAMLWRFQPDTPNKTAAPILAVAATQLGDRILCARLAVPAGPEGADSSIEHLLVAHGPMANPAFAEARAPPTGSTAVVKRLTAAAHDSKTAKAGHTSQAAKAPSATILGPLEVAAAVQHQQQKRALEGTVEEMRPEKALKLPEVRQRAGHALSIAPLIRQGLRSKDANSMDEVFKVRDNGTIDASISELSGTEGFDLLQAITLKFVADPKQVQVLSFWIQRVLVHHCAFISSQPVLRRALKPLQEALRTRLTMAGANAMLRSRLWMAVSLGRQHERAHKEAKECALEPLVEYEEGQSEAEDEDNNEDEDGEDDEDDDEDGEGGVSDLDDIFDSDAESI